MRNFNRWLTIVLLVLIIIVGRTLLVSSIKPKANKHLFAEFDPDHFSNSFQIDNKWLPLKPGTRWVYEGTTIEKNNNVPHRLEMTVTDLSKEIAGVKTLVVWSVDISDNQVVEKEIAFFGQDDSGNVWYFGEYPEEYDNGKFVDAPTWIAGIDEARTGIKMWADPKIDLPSYFQGWGPTVEWSDWAKVDSFEQKLCVKVNCYKDVLLIAESSLEEKNVYQLKYYAQNVGNIAVSWRGNDALKEKLELVEFVQLNPEQLSVYRSEAQKLEKSAYEKSLNVYAQTKPSEQSIVQNK